MACVGEDLATQASLAEEILRHQVPRQDLRWPGTEIRRIQGSWSPAGPELGLAGLRDWGPLWKKK